MNTHTIKLHLGCGQRYIKGYINIDYPHDKHTVMEIKADRYADITNLTYEPNTIDEIRLHHVFEHFSRPVALALLCRWRDWLKPEGLLRIETPDLMQSVALLSNPLHSYNIKQQVIRHLFGSHEAAWAVHWDGWYKEKYQKTLLKLGFQQLIFKRNSWGSLRNIEVFARKSMEKLCAEDYYAQVSHLLEESTIRVNTTPLDKAQGSEKALLKVWLCKWKRVYEHS